MENDLGIARARHGYLGHWAEQGVLLLNNCLTVEAGQAASHRGKGWERFTDAVVAAVASAPAPKVFLLWGSHPQRKEANVPGLGPEIGQASGRERVGKGVELSGIPGTTKKKN